MPHEKTLRRVTMALAFGSAASLVTILVITALTGVNGQHFESVDDPARYLERLLAADAPLRWLLTIDAVFIACYSAMVLGFAGILRRQGAFAPLVWALGGASVMAALLDVVENHHILAMLEAARLGVPPALGELSFQETASGSKWILAHTAFFFAGLVIEGRAPWVRAFRAALIAVQLPIGAATLTVSDPAYAELLLWARALNLLAGFGFVALYVRTPSKVSTEESLIAVGVDSGVPA